MDEVKRFDMTVIDYAYMEDCRSESVIGEVSGGNFVLHSDYLAEVERLQARVSELESALKRQANSAKMGIDAAKKDAIWREDNAKRLLAESNPAALESERAMNAELTAENERLQARVASLEYSLWEAEDPTNPNAFILRKQAEAVENLAKTIERIKDGAFDEGEVSAYAHSASLAEQEAMRLRNDAGKAGGGV